MKYRVKIKHLSRSSLSILPFLLKLFNGMAKNGFLAFFTAGIGTTSITRQITWIFDEDKVVSFAYAAPRHCPSRNSPVSESSVLMRNRGLKASIRLIASTNVYEDGITRQDLVIFHEYESQNLWNKSALFQFRFRK